MRFISRIVILPAAVAACGIVTGCFSYHKTVDATTPAPVVETAPAETTVVPVPATSSSTTTTTTDSNNGVVERQRTSTYTAPY
jgi:hypothetical protein